MVSGRGTVRPYRDQSVAPSARSKLRLRGSPGRAADPGLISLPSGNPPLGMEGPRHPTDLGARSWWGVLKRTVSEFRDDNLTDWAASLTYYAILAIFPALIVLVSILGLAGDSATNAMLDNINE